MYEPVFTREYWDIAVWGKITGINLFVFLNGQNQGVTPVETLQRHGWDLEKIERAKNGES